MADKEEVQDTDDYKLSKSGRKIRAHRIIFNKGDDDGKKGITEMKKTYKDFVEQHTAELTEEQKNEIVVELQEVLSKDASAGDWISDFVHSENPKFAGKSKEKRKQMALAAYYAQRNEEVEQIDELKLHFAADDANNTINAKKMVAHLKKRGISASHQSGSAHRAVVNVDTKNSSDKAYIKNKVKDRYDVDVREEVDIDEASYINGVKQDPESKVWKLTSMSHAEAIAKHGKENVRHVDAINRSGDKTGKKHVEVLSKLGEELKGNQHKIDKNKNGKIDKHDFKLLRKENAEQIDEAIDADDYTATSEKSQFGGHRPHVVNKETGKTMHLSASSYKSPEHAKAHAKAYLSAYAKTGMHAADRAAQDYAKANKDKQVSRKEEVEHMEESQSHQSKTTMKHVSNPTAGEKKAAKDIKPGIAGYRDRIAMLKSAQARGALKKEEIANESTFDWKNTPRQTSDSSKTKTYHDVKKVSTGTVYTKQFDKDGMSKGTGDDAAKKAEGAAKRGRGRPKKDKFAEAVEFLLSLSEEHFEDMMEEGFDAFAEEFEQLDELSKSTLGSYAKKATYDAKFKGHQAGFSQGHAMARSKELFGGVEAGADQDDKAHKRLKGISKAVDRLTK
jgi:hypothetical protein